MHLSHNPIPVLLYTRHIHGTRKNVSLAKDMDDDPSISATGLVLECEDAAALEVQKAEYSGDWAVFSVVVNSAIESGLYRRTGTGWERVRTSNRTWAAQGEAYKAYMAELEDIGAGER